MLPVSFTSLVAEHLEWLFSTFNGVCGSQLIWIFFLLISSEKAGDALVLSSMRQSLVRKLLLNLLSAIPEFSIYRVQLLRKMLHLKQIVFRPVWRISLGDV